MRHLSGPREPESVDDNDEIIMLEQVVRYLGIPLFTAKEWMSITMLGSEVIAI